MHADFHLDRSIAGRFKYAIILTAVTMVAEVVGGLLTHSLALLSDAAHVLLDIVALGMSYIALRLAARPADDRYTYGYHRFEVLAALASAPNSNSASPESTNANEAFLMNGSLSSGLRPAQQEDMFDQRRAGLEQRGAFWDETAGSVVFCFLGLSHLVELPFPVCVLRSALLGGGDAAGICHTIYLRAGKLFRLQAGTDPS